MNRYLARFVEAGPAGLLDRRQSNYRKLDAAAEGRIVQAKLDGPHRSARLLRDLLRLPVHPDTVRRVLVKHHLERTSLPPVKPIRRFQAAEPNELWQLDIQGKVHFPLLGDLLLILAKDDHSRFLLAGRWFFHQYKINVFMVLQEACRRWGLPRALLTDRGGQFRTHQLHGETEYQYLARRLGIELRYARQARTKGKVENTFRFVQRDFVLENLAHPTLASLNAAWATWMAWYNWQHRHKGLNGDSPADHYVAYPRQGRPRTWSCSWSTRNRGRSCGRGTSATTASSTGSRTATLGAGSGPCSRGTPSGSSAAGRSSPAIRSRPTTSRPTPGTVQMRRTGTTEIRTHTRAAC